MNPAGLKKREEHFPDFVPPYQYFEHNGYQYARENA